jgi:hypothetical protein
LVPALAGAAAGRSNPPPLKGVSRAGTMFRSNPCSTNGLILKK